MNELMQPTLYPVKEVPAIGYKVTQSGYKFIVRGDNDKVLSCMTNDYKLVTNKTIIDYADPIIKKNNGKIKEVRTFNDGAKTMMRWTFPDQTVRIGHNDEKPNSSLYESIF